MLYLESQRKEFYTLPGLLPLLAEIFTEGDSASELSQKRVVLGKKFYALM